MTYLEIDGIIEATGTFYATYRVKLLNTEAKILAGRSPAERKFIKQILDAAELKRWWLYFYPTLLAEKFNTPRAKIVSALNGLQSAGDVILSVWGVRNGYRVKKDSGDLNVLTAALVEKFQSRERADIVRLQQVLGLSAYRGCLTGYLTKHFGEKLDSPCGHCDRCRGVPSKMIKRPRFRRVTDEEIALVRSLVDEKHAALNTPRQLARFLCGMASPAAARARLTRHSAFGLLAALPFSEVLTVAEVA
jgi:ATP-dependent DNA helicase RecQ